MMKTPSICSRTGLPIRTSGPAWPVRLSNTLLLWLTRVRQRRALHTLSDHMLKDIGVSRADAAREVGKRFWRG